MGHLAIPASAFESLPAEMRDARIIALCDRAISGLKEARDLDEVISIRNAAEAFATYTRKMKAAVEAKNECELVVLLAEARIGAELAKAQERGEVARADGAVNQHRREGVHGSDTHPATLPEIGIPRQRASEMKKLADAGEGRIRAEVKRASDEGRRPSRRNILNAIPVIAERPLECSQFILWLRTGARLMPELGSPDAFRARMEHHRMPIPAAELEAVVTFLSLLGETA